MHGRESDPASGMELLQEIMAEHGIRLRKDGSTILIEWPSQTEQDPAGLAAIEQAGELLKDHRDEVGERWDELMEVE